MVDSSSSMHLPLPVSKWSTLVQLLTLIGTILQKQRDGMGMLEINETGSHFYESKATSEWIKLMLSHLSKKDGETKKNANIAFEIEALMSKIPRRSQVILFIDLFQENLEEILDSAALLAFEGHSVRCTFISHAKLEQNEEYFAGRQVIDSETGSKAYINQNDAKRYVSFVEAQKERAITLSRNLNLNCKILDASHEPMYLLRELLA